jgi:hypothetical protein
MRLVSLCHKIRQGYLPFTGIPPHAWRVCQKMAIHPTGVIYFQEPTVWLIRDGSFTQISINNPAPSPII